MVTLEEYWRGYEKKFRPEFTEEIQKNGKHTVETVNKLLSVFGQDRQLTSGWRPVAVNKRTKGASKTSRHLTARAADIDDRDRVLTAFCLLNQDLLEELGLWMESPERTPRWVHVQTTEPPSKKRVF